MSRVTDCTNVSASSHCDEDSKTEVEPLRLELDEHADYYPDSLKIQGVVRTPRQHVGGIPYSASHIIGSLTTRAIHPKAMQRAHHSKQSWEDNRPVIEQLWRRDGLALKQVKEVMDKRGFVASEREYYPRLKQWGLTKNIRGEDMSILYRKMVQRKAVEDKDTNFTLHGQAVDLKRIHRFVKRVALSPSGLPEQATPVYVFAFTPRSPHKNNCVTFPWSQSPHKHFLQIMKGKLAETAQRESLYDLSWLDEQTGNLNEFDLGFGDETLTSCSTVDFDSHPIIYYTKERKDSIFPAFGLQLIKGDFDTI
ncbi:hypothetical protein GGR57DRAFT_66788 [Xylariaceae sp. FL1272]|nr:hypothetical protein GGR57DRAFT_66788 [Xylariaceae sp. FL1272]